MCASAKPERVLHGLLKHLQDGEEVLHWYRICLEECPLTEKIKSINPLFTALQRHPDNESLALLILDNAAFKPINKSHKLTAHWDAEACTPLIRALAIRPHISAKLVWQLLASLGTAAHPWFITPKTEVSAALLCILDKSRTSLLERIVQANEAEALAYEVAVETFVGLVALTNPTAAAFNREDLPERLSLRLASLYVGNVGAFCLLGARHAPEDGLLHTAALMALPRLVEWLLQDYDANATEEEFDLLIPLAVACRAVQVPWSVVADQEADFRARQKETMRLLAKHTDLTWRDRGKTVMHIALEGGSEVTEAMCEALEFDKHPYRASVHTYTDKAGRKHDLPEYVRECLDEVDATERVKLQTLINKILPSK